MGPWIERQSLIDSAKKFVQQHGLFLRRSGPRISSLVEIAVYNSIVEYYESLKFTVAAKNLGPKKSFLYKLSATGLAENYSYFLVEKDGVAFHVLHNISVQSAHNEHLYFTADVVVTEQNGATTARLASGRRHSFVANPDLVTFVEVKHLTPFPEVLFSFMGLVLEFMPSFVKETVILSDAGFRLSPTIAFTGPGSGHSERIQESLIQRYGINVVFGTSSTLGKLTAFDMMKKYRKPFRLFKTPRNPDPKFSICKLYEQLSRT